MSHSYTTRAYTVRAQGLPATFASLEEFEAFAQDAGDVAHGRTDGLHHLWGHTRGGWAIYLTKRLLAELPDTSTLQFLTDAGTTVKFEDEYGFTAVSVLDPQAVVRAADRFEAVLQTLKAEPMRVWDADTGGVLYDDVSEALARDYTSNNPAFDRQVRGDEGEGTDYLCTYWRSILALLRAAQHEGAGVVFSLKV